VHPTRRITAIVLSVLLAITATTATTAAVASPPRPGPAHAHQSLLATGLSGGAGSTIGPDGALYVTEPQAGEVSRVDRRTGAVTTFVSGLPEQAPGTPGGAVDVAFLGRTAYVLVTLADPDVSGL
jgi:hypothetical protein